MAFEKWRQWQAQYSFSAAEARTESSAISIKVGKVVRRSNHNTGDTAVDNLNLNDTHNHAENETPAFRQRRSKLLAQQSFYFIAVFLCAYVAAIITM